MRSTIRVKTEKGWKTFPVTADCILLGEFENWLKILPDVEFSNVIVNRDSKKTTLRYLDLSTYSGHIINAEEADLILDAYNKLLAKKSINERHILNVQKFIVDEKEKYIGHLTKKQFELLTTQLTK